MTSSRPLQWMEFFSQPKKSLLLIPKGSSTGVRKAALQSRSCDQLCQLSLERNKRYIDSTCVQLFYLTNWHSFLSMMLLHFSSSNLVWNRQDNLIYRIPILSLVVFDIILLLSEYIFSLFLETQSHGNHGRYMAKKIFLLVTSRVQVISIWLTPNCIYLVNAYMHFRFSVNKISKTMKNVW